MNELDSHDIVLKMSRSTRWILRIFGKKLNREFFSPLCNRLYSNRDIDSGQLHIIHKEFDPTQRGIMGRV